MSSHAILSPSGASRWLNCTPSARLEQQFPDTAGDAAKEGTLAHSLGELLLRRYNKEISQKQFLAQAQVIEADPMYNAAMWEYCENYATYVMERYAEAQQRNKNATLLIEQQLDLTEYIEDGFGTGDAGICSDDYLDVIDLKYGKGVQVSAENNPQMKLYALGWLNRLGLLFDMHTVRMTIYQPRIDNISSFEMTTEELLKWAAEELTPKAALAFAGEGEFKPGKHCQFCKARALCKANADYNLEIARHEFKDPVLLTDEDVADILDREKMFKSWLESVTGHALTQAVNHGKKWPGWKLVEGRSNRVITDEEKVVATLAKLQYSTDDIYKPLELQGVTAFEKLLGKKEFADKLGPYVVKPPGKPTLAPEIDKRPEFSSTEQLKSEFADD